jgi:hypothetical protein
VIEAVTRAASLVREQCCRLSPKGHQLVAIQCQAPLTSVCLFQMKTNDLIVLSWNMAR